MDLTWRICLAALGLLSLRKVVYPPGWGHVELWRVFHAVIGAFAVRPLASHSTAGWYTCLVGLIIVWLPIGRLSFIFLSWVTRADMARVAASYGSEVVDDEAHGLFHFRATVDRQSLWAGNVLTETRSIHPASDKRETTCMLAFVAELSAPPSLQCSLMKGWDKPLYHEREWRQTMVVRGDSLSMSLDSLFEDKATRDTKGDCDGLHVYDGRQFKKFLDGFCILVDDDALFEASFGGELAEDLWNISALTSRFEFNVTPTSINVYTIYCSQYYQERICNFLLKASQELVPREE